MTRMLALAVGVLVIVLGYVWWTSEERAVERRLGQLAETLSVPAKDTDLGRIARIARLRNYLAEDIRVKADGRELTSRDAVLAFAARTQAQGVTVEFADVQTTFGPDKTSAQVYLTAKVTGRDPRTDEPTVDAREAAVTMAKRRDGWVVTSAEARETLQRP